jgi:hypothetical protein
MNSKPTLLLDDQNGDSISDLYVVTEEMISIDIQRYINDEDGDSVIASIKSGQLPRGLSFNNGVISGSLEEVASSELILELNDGSSIESYTVELTGIDRDWVEGTFDSRLDIVLGSLDQTFNPTSIPNDFTFYSIYQDEFDVTVLSDGTFNSKNYLIYGDYSSPEYTYSLEASMEAITDGFSYSISLPGLSIDVTLFDPRVVESIDRREVDGLYIVQAKGKVTGPLLLKDSEWNEAFWYPFGANNKMTDLFAVEEYYLSGSESIQVSPNYSKYAEIDLNSDGTVTERIQDGTVRSTWVDNTGNQNFEFNYVRSSNVIGSWINSSTSGYDGNIAISLNDGATIYFKADPNNETILATVLPSVSREVDLGHIYYGIGLQAFTEAIFVPSIPLVVEPDEPSISLYANQNTIDEQSGVLEFQLTTSKPTSQPIDVLIDYGVLDYRIFDAPSVITIQAGQTSVKWDVMISSNTFREESTEVIATISEVSFGIVENSSASTVIVDELPIDASNSPSPVQITGTYLDEKLLGGFSDDSINGNGGNDSISGGFGDDLLSAGVGNDLIEGGIGQDIIDAGEGDDKIYGGLGVDLISTGNGIDRIFFESVSDFGDTITDFSSDDIIDVTKILEGTISDSYIATDYLSLAQSGSSVNVNLEVAGSTEFLVSLSNVNLSDISYDQFWLKSNGWAGKAYHWASKELLDVTQESKLDPLELTLTSNEEGRVISASDALAALKLAVGINPNSNGFAASPYQYLAADVNEDGRVSAADALSILKMAVGLEGAPERQWVFVNESTAFWDEATQSYTVDRSHIDWANIAADVADLSPSDQVVATLKGGVNASWLGSSELGVIEDSYFNNLDLAGTGPLQQWWIA